MSPKTFRRRVGGHFAGCSIRYAFNEVEYLASVTSTPSGAEVICQSGPYREEIAMFWHGKPIGALPW